MTVCSGRGLYHVGHFGVRLGAPLLPPLPHLLTFEIKTSVRILS